MHDSLTSTTWYYICHSENRDMQSIYHSLTNNLGDSLPRKKIFKSWHRLNYKQCPHTPISHSSSRPPLYALWQQQFLHYQRIWRESLVNHLNFSIVSMYGLDQIFDDSWVNFVCASPHFLHHTTSTGFHQSSHLLKLLLLFVAFEGEHTSSLPERLFFGKNSPCVGIGYSVDLEKFEVTC